MASPTQWTWVWVDSCSWWWIRWPVVLQFMGLQRVIHDWVAELNWTNTITMSDRISAYESGISVHSRGNSELLVWCQLRLAEDGIYSVYCISWAYEAVLCNPSAILRLHGGHLQTISVAEPGFREQPWNHLLTDYLFHSLSNYIFLALSFFSGINPGNGQEACLSWGSAPRDAKGKRAKI